VSGASPSSSLSLVERESPEDHYPTGVLIIVKFLLLTPELFANDGGIARILRLYLKALCEMSEEGDSVRFLSLNDRVVDSTDLRRYSGKGLVEWQVCSRSKLRFIRAALRMGMESDRIICGHVAQLPVVWLVSKLRPGLRYYLVAHGIEVWRPFSFLQRHIPKRAPFLS
jgi:phosphatidyl-myo-inositol dimannoside synthase